MKQHNTLGLLAVCAIFSIFLLIFGCFGSGPNKNDFSGKIVIDGRERTYIGHIPEGMNVDDNYPLVVVFHGGGGNAENATRMSEMSAKADKEGFIVIYPNGTSAGLTNLLTWNAWTCCGYANDNNIDDVKFVKELIAQIKDIYNIDTKRIYATGLSNGAFLSYKLACEMSDTFAAVAPVAGSLTGTCNPTDPVSILIFHGTDDQLVPYSGGVGTASADVREPDQPVSFAVNFWVSRNQCTTTPGVEQFGSIKAETYSACLNSTEVKAYTIYGGGHAWPGGKEGIQNGNVDKPTAEISATDIIWEFFSKHPKK
ncbi:MAG: PHB depolymerase family esterase [archaeon]